MKPTLLRRIRQAVQVLALLAFLYLFASATSLNPLREQSNLFFRLDPLAAAAAMLAGRAFIAGMALSGIVLLLTLVLGRVWCGWLCPMGTVLDVVRPRRRAARSRLKPPPERLRLVKYLLLAFVLFAALFGSQALMFLDPVTLLTRTLSTAVWPALRHAVVAVEKVLYNFEFLWPLLDAVHAGVVYPLFKDTQPVYLLAVPVLMFFAGIAALNWWAERFWCRYLCPLGGLLGLAARFAPLRRVVGETCSGCAACAPRCPTGTIDPARGYASDPAECTVCLDCLAACRKNGSDFRFTRPETPVIGKQAYDPTRRDALGMLGLAAGWAALSGVETIRARRPADLVRPPGADLTGFESLCIRCSACVKVCPTHGLQPGLLEGGWQNLLTPRLVARLGACSFNCAACGEVCPTGAIPRLALEEKQQTPIGLARVDHTRCLPWAYNIDCIVCEEACPVADKAILLEVVEVTNGLGEQVTMQRPYVVKERCIGCGMCEYQCPMGGDAAIRVLAYTEAGGYLGGG